MPWSSVCATTNYGYANPFTSHKLAGLTGAQVKNITYDAIGNIDADFLSQPHFVKAPTAQH